MKISQEIDNQILIELALNKPNKEIAKKFNVSESYISKVKRGKKIPSIKLNESTVINTDFFKIDNNILNNVLISLNNIKLDKKELEKYLEAKMKNCLVEASIYQTLLNIIGGK